MMNRFEEYFASLYIMVYAVETKDVRVRIWACVEISRSGC